MVGAAPVSVFHNVAQSFVHREIELFGALLGKCSPWDASTKFTHEGACMRKFAEIARDLDLAAGEGELAFFDLDDDAGQVIREGLRIRKGGDRSADFRDQLRGIEPAIEPHAFGETADAEELARAILGFGNSVGIEDKHVFRLEGLSDLFIDFPFAHPKRHVRALQRRAGGRAMPIVDYRHVPAIDELDLAPVEIKPDVGDSHEAFETNELPDNFRVGEGDDLFGFWQRSTIRKGNNLAEGLKEGAFGRRPEQRRGNALAHDVADDDIEALVNVPEKVIEIAADPLRGNRKRRHMRPGEIPRRLIEKQRLLKS